MTTKEKARELANCQNCIDVALKIKNVKVCNPDERPCERYKNLLEMAQWKQQQMIDKAVEWLKENADKYVGRALEEYDMQYYGCISIDNLIEDFKQAMKEE